MVLKAGGRQVQIKETTRNSKVWTLYKGNFQNMTGFNKQCNFASLLGMTPACESLISLVPNFAKILRSCEINGVMGSFTIVHKMRILECHFSQISFSICVGNRNKISVKLLKVEPTQSKSPLKLLAQPQPAAP